MLERSGGGVAWIGEGGEPLLVALGIDTGKGLLRKIDLPPHLQCVRNRLPVEFSGDAGNRADVASHLVTHRPVATGRGADQMAFFVK